MNIGFFQNFKGTDSVLLECTAEEIEDISNQLETSSIKSGHKLAIHELATVSQHNPAQLFVLFSNAQPMHHANGAFYWLCAGDELMNIKDRLKFLSSTGAGHQYFALAGSSAQLIVSVGEYGESWWAQNG